MKFATKFPGEFCIAMVCCFALRSVANLSCFVLNVGTLAEKWRAVLHDYRLNERHCGSVTSFLIRMGVRDVKFRGFCELVDKIELAYDMEFSYPKAKAKVKVLCANQEAATYDEHIDGMCIDSTVEMLRDCGLTNEEAMAELYDRNHHAWCAPDHHLRSDVLLSITDWWNGQGGVPCSSIILRGGLRIFPTLLLSFPFLLLFLHQLVWVVWELLPPLLCRIPLCLLLRWCPLLYLQPDWFLLLLKLFLICLS